MKRESDKHKLIANLLADESDLRESTLQHGLMLSRRKRQRRRAVHASLWILPFLLIAATILFQLRYESKRTVHIPRLSRGAINSAAQAPQVIEGTSVRILSDTELLDLFKGRPVALVGPPGKQTLLLFDEKPN
jgi:hypothetical protein